MDSIFSDEGASLGPEGSLEAANDSIERGGLVTARGTAEGLVVRLDGRVEADSLKKALLDFLNSRRSFLGGNEVALEWVGKKPEESFLAEVSEVLSRDFKITVRSSKLRDPAKHEGGKHHAAEDFNIDEDSPHLVREVHFGKEAHRSSDPSLKPLGLFSGVEDLPFTAQEEVERSAIPERSDSNAESFLWDDPDARIVYTTLRSGQKIETEHSLIIFGDVNSGAEIVAGGDIAVMGTLRGVAHAGAYDETGAGRFIFALNLQPTQLRIGSIISRGASDGLKGPEIARVDANMIVVETYQTKNAALRRRG